MTTAEIIIGIIDREGGYSNRAADRGGPTNMGITQATLARWRGHPVTAEDVKALTRPEAADIYAAQYVTPWGFVGHEPTLVLLVDWGVTSGADDPGRALQEVLTAMGHSPGAIDGVVGPKTRAAYVASGSPDLVTPITVARVKFYVSLALDREARAFMAQSQTTQLHNLRGWVNRALGFLTDGE